MINFINDVKLVKMLESKFQRLNFVNGVKFINEIKIINDVNS